MTKKKAPPKPAPAAWVDIATLKPWRRNPRDNAAAVRDVAQSITRFGWGAPILAREDDRRIIAGHTRYKAAQELGLEEVPVRFLNLNEEEATLLALADNKLGELASWDEVKLEEVIQELADEDVDLAGLGWDDDELGQILQTLEKELGDGDPDEIPDELQEDPITQLGDTWHLGPHRLLCADSLTDDTRAWVMAHKIDAAITDPPFAIYGSSTGLSAEMTDDRSVRPLFHAVCKQLEALLPWFGTAHIFCDWRSWPSWWESTRDTALDPKNLLVWDKGNFGLGFNYGNSHELVGYLIKQPKSKTMIKSRPAGLRAVSVSNILRHPRVTGDEREHNAAKPVALLEALIEHVTEPGQRVVDLFGGSGSTLVAAERADRVCVMVEIEPRWCDVIVERWERLTDKKAERHPSQSAE